MGTAWAIDREVEVACGDSICKGGSDLLSVPGS